MAEPLTLYKLIILYMLNKVDFPLTNAQISGFILDKGYTNYFHLQQAISELIDASLVQSKTIRNASHLQITEQGKKTLSYFEYEISDAIKDDITTFFTEKTIALRKEVSVTSEYYQSGRDGYMVECCVKEHNTSVIDLKLTVPAKEAAETICAKWKSKHQEVYDVLMEVLLQD